MTLTVPQVPLGRKAGSISTSPLSVDVGLCCLDTVPSAVLTEEMIQGQGILILISFTVDPEKLQSVQVAVYVPFPLLTTEPGVAEHRATWPVLEVAVLEVKESAVALPWKEYVCPADPLIV